MVAQVSIYFYHCLIGMKLILIELEDHWEGENKLLILGLRGQRSRSQTLLFTGLYYRSNN